MLFTSQKTVLKSWLDTSSIPYYLSSFSSIFLKRNLNTSSIPSGSIEKAPTSSITPRHLVNRSSFCSWNWFFVAQYFLDTSAVNDHFLDTSFDNFLDTSRYLRCPALLKVLFKPPSQSVSHFFNLFRSVHVCSSPKHSLFHSQPLPQGFFKLFQVFLHLVSI